MNNPFDKIATTSLPLLSEGFRESLETRLQPVLKRRRQQRQFHLTLICGSAAVIVLGLCLGLSQIGTFSPRQGPDKSPVPAVSSLSLDQLLEKHFNSPQTDASVTQALGKALAALPYERLLEIMQEYGPASGQSNTLQGDFSVKASDKSPPNLAEVVENNDWMVHVIINQVTLNTEELLDMILRKDLTYNRIHDASLGRVRLDLDLQVLDAAPDLPAENAEQLTFWCFVPYEQHELWQAGREVIIPLCHQWGRYRLGSDRSRQMYWVKLNEHQEKTVTIDHCEFPLDQAWDLIQDQVFIAKAKHKTQLVQYATRALSAAKGKPVLNQTRLESLEAAVARYERSAQTGDAVTDLISTFETHLQPTDIQFLPVLQEVIGKDWHGRGWRTPNLIADTMPDPSLIPALQKAVYDPNNWYLKRGNAYLLRALFASGATEEAITIALQTLTAPVHESDAEAFDHDMYRRRPLMLFLGETGDTSLLDIVETYTREETIQPLRDISRRMQRAHEFRINAIQRNAVLALARLGGEATIPRLQELYQHHDVFVRIVAAFSLHALGDDTAYDLIQHFAEATERALPEVEKRWSYDMSDGVFVKPLRYLHSPRTDALLKARQDNLRTQTRD